MVVGFSLGYHEDYPLAYRCNVLWGYVIDNLRGIML